MRGGRVVAAGVALLLSLPVTSKAQYAVGDTVRDFVLKNLRGADVRLKAYEGKVVLLNFFATW